jgi:uncharacterized protein YbaP (TraB family)
MKPFPALLRLLAATAVVLALLVGPALAKPALWVVRGATATIYLFGTIHALKPDMQWHSPKLDHAFGEAKEIWFEIADAGFYRAAIPLMQKLGTDYRVPLSAKLPKAELDQIDAALRRAGVKEGRARYEWVRPWVLALMLGGGPTKGMGLERGSGADLSLQEDAVEADKPVHALETKEQQLRIFADLPPDIELTLLDNALAHMDEGPARLDALLAAWMAGDVETIGKLSFAHDSPSSEVLYQKLLVDRNKNWAKQIAELLKGNGTILICGGAGHFAGPDSVLAQLQALGIKAERVQ